MILVPAAFSKIAVDGGLDTRDLSGDGSRTDVAALALVFVRHYVVVLYRVENFGPVEGGEVAEFGVLLHAHGSTRDVHQTREPHLLQLQHLEDHQGVVEEQVVATDDSEVGKQVPKTLQTIDAEQQQVVCDHHQLGEPQATEVLSSGLEHQQDLQVAFDHCAVLQRAQVGHVIPDVFAGAD